MKGISVVGLLCCVALCWGRKHGPILKEREDQKSIMMCPIGQLPTTIENFDGFLDLVCQPFPDVQCSKELKAKLKMPVTCNPNWMKKCPPKHFIGAIKRVYVLTGRGNRKAWHIHFKTLCCTHHIMQTMMVSIRKHRLKPSEKFDLDATAMKISYIAAIEPHGEFDHQWLDIGTVFLKYKKDKDCEDKERKPKPHVPPMSKEQCFAPHSLLQTEGGVKRMDQIQIGDKVLSTTWDGKVASYQPVTHFLHREANTMGDFVNIKTESGRELSLTPQHLLPLFPCPSNHADTPSGLSFSAHTRFARHATPGLCVMATGNGKGQFVAERIVQVTKSSEPGIYSPVTDTGVIVVNGIQASCYSQIENHYLQHAVFSGVTRLDQLRKRAMDRVWRAVFGSGEELNPTPLEQDVPPVVRVVEKMFHLAIGI